jgi:hypothetical protein
MCPHAAKRLLDKLYGCSFNTDGMSESAVCSSMTYSRVIELEVFNCRELSNMLAGAK